MPLPRIQAITFDLDDSLWAIEPVLARADQALHDWLHEHHAPVAARFSPAGLRQLRRDTDAAHPELAHDLTALRLLALETAFSLAGADAGAARDAFDVFSRVRNDVQLFPDVLAALQTLRAHYPLGTLSNGNADVDTIGLGDYFSFRVTARAAGVAKPDPAIFARASTLAGVPPQAMLHVGDDPECDVAGAKAAGFAAVWLNRAGRAWAREDCAPDLEITDLHALVRALGL